MQPILTRDATDQLAALAAGEVTAVGLLDAVLARHAATHARLNAVIATDLDRARADAGAIDAARAAGRPLGLLAGLPMTVKDTLDVAGLPASSGLAKFLDRDAADAEAVARARAAGAVIWGKTNSPVMASDWQSANPLYGVTRNPWDLTRTPGGSSGGAAAALAAFVTALEIGSDIGGSLRIPAAFCGVYAHKPTWGVVSQDGHVPPKPGGSTDRDLNVVGPMARSARDLALLFQVLTGQAAPAADLRGVRIGLWLDAPAFPLDPQVRAGLVAFAARLTAAGAVVTPIESPVDTDTLMRAYQVLLATALREDFPSQVLARMGAMRRDAEAQVRAGAGPLSQAAAVLAYTATADERAAAQAVRAALRVQMAAVFETLDVVLAPIAPVTAFPHDPAPFDDRCLTASDGTTFGYNNMLNWIALATALGLPATAIPTGLSSQGLPVGAQLIGPFGADRRTLGLAQAIETAIGGFVAPPAI